MANEENNLNPGAEEISEEDLSQVTGGAGIDPAANNFKTVIQQKLETKSGPVSYDIAANAKS